MKHSRSHFTRSSGRGFALVEVLSALIIFSVAIIAFIQAMGNSIAVQAGLISRHRAAMLAEDILEEIQYSGDLEEGTQSGELEGDLTYGWETNTEPTENDGLMRVTVTVTWNDGHSGQNYKISTFMMLRNTEETQ